MRCKGCEYPLWNMAPRVCPECGLKFSPADYTFVPNSVRFCCPHCRQAYYGLSERGLIEPPEFDCVSCNTRISIDEMILLPAEGVNEEVTRGATCHWRERKKIGRIVAWFKTTGAASFLPHQLARGCGQEVRVADAVKYALVSMTLYWGLLACLAIFLFTFSWMGRLGQQTTFADVMKTFGLAAAWFIGAPLVFGVVLWLWAACTHLILDARKRLPMGATVEAFFYGSGSMFLMAIPCAGFYAIPLAFLWLCTSATIQLAIRHEAHWGRATLAVLTPPIVAIGLVIGVIVVLINFT